MESWESDLKSTLPTDSCLEVALEVTTFGTHGRAFRRYDLVLDKRTTKAMQQTPSLPGIKQSPESKRKNGF